MSDADNQQLHPVVVALAQDFQVSDGQWQVPGERLVEHHQRLQACGSELRDKLITDLVVLAARFEREAAARAQIALAQLLALAAALLGGSAAAAEAFASAGLDVTDAKKLIGTAGVKFEDTSQRQPGQAAASLLGMLKGNK